MQSWTQVWEHTLGGRTIRDYQLAGDFDSAMEQVARGRFEQGRQYSHSIFVDPLALEVEELDLEDGLREWMAEHMPDLLEETMQSEADDRWIDERKHEGRLF